MLTKRNGITHGYTYTYVQLLLLMLAVLPINMQAINFSNANGPLGKFKILALTLKFEAASFASLLIKGRPSRHLEEICNITEITRSASLMLTKYS